MKAKTKISHYYGSIPYARRRMPNNDGKIFQNSAPFQPIIAVSVD